MSRSSIRRQIRQKQTEVRQCERVKRINSQEQKRLIQQNERWDIYKRVLAQEEMTGEVVVRHYFEGMSAKHVRNYFFDGIGYKNSKNIAMADTLNELETMQQKIEQRICDLEWEIESLYRDLADYD